MMFEKDTKDRMVRNGPVCFSFLGDRNYIDVSTIHRQIWPYLGVNELSELQSYRVRIQKKIERNGRLSVYEERMTPELFSQADVSFQFVRDRRIFWGLIFPSSEKIEARGPEPAYNLSDYMTHTDSRTVRLVRAFNKDLVYNLMKLGKAVILEAGFGQQPRVGEFRFDFIPHHKDFEQLSMEISPSFNPKIFVLSCFLGPKVFGRVFVASKPEDKEVEAHK